MHLSYDTDLFYHLITFTELTALFPNLFFILAPTFAETNQTLLLCFPMDNHRNCHSGYSQYQINDCIQNKCPFTHAKKYP